MPATAVLRLEAPTFPLHTGFDVWNAKGALVLRTMTMTRVLKRKAVYFRANSSGRVFELVNKNKSIEIPADAIEWRT